MRVILICVGVPGLEPGKAGPESAVLPITPYPNLGVQGGTLSPRLRVQKYTLLAKRPNFFRKKCGFGVLLVVFSRLIEKSRRQ